MSLRSVPDSEEMIRDFPDGIRRNEQSRNDHRLPPKAENHIRLKMYSGRHKMYRSRQIIATSLLVAVSYVLDEYREGNEPESIGMTLVK